MYKDHSLSQQHVLMKIYVQDCRLSQWSGWRPRSTGMWHSVVGQAVPNLLKDHSIFIFRILLGMLNPLQNIVCGFHYAFLSLLMIISSLLSDIVMSFLSLGPVFLLFWFQWIVLADSVTVFLQAHSIWLPFSQLCVPMPMHFALTMRSVYLDLAFPPTNQ
jgi:hypothetical protein